MTQPGNSEHDEALQDGGADGAADGIVTPDPDGDGGADKGGQDDPGKSEADGAA